MAEIWVFSQRYIWHHRVWRFSQIENIFIFFAKKSRFQNYGLFGPPDFEITSRGFFAFL
jgi:hypothetical protein